MLYDRLPARGGSIFESFKVGELDCERRVREGTEYDETNVYFLPKAVACTTNMWGSAIGVNLRASDWLPSG